MNTERLYTREKLEQKLSCLKDNLDIFKILAAYDIAESAYQYKFRAGGVPHFEHISRVCQIVVEELSLSEGDIIIASLLQDILSISEEISINVLDFNFGKYTASLIETLNFEYKRQKQLLFQVNDLSVLGGPYGLILRLSKSLDNIRYFDFELFENPISYFNSIKYKYFHLAEQTDDKSVKYLFHEIKKESNKIFC